MVEFLTRDVTRVFEQGGVLFIYGSGRKTDKLDAPKLARLARADSEVLHPVKDRRKDCQAHLALIHAREALVHARTQLINHARGTVKSFGARLPGCSVRSFHKKVRDQLPPNSPRVSNP